MTRIKFRNVSPASAGTGLATAHDAQDATEAGGEKTSKDRSPPTDQHTSYLGPTARHNASGAMLKLSGASPLAARCVKRRDATSTPRAIKAKFGESGQVDSGKARLRVGAPRVPYEKKDVRTR